MFLLLLLFQTNVEGPLCDNCRQGTFGLNASLPEGCQECFCAGVTDQCVESNLYTEQIPSQIIDQSNHGFILTDQFVFHLLLTSVWIVCCFLFTFLYCDCVGVDVRPSLTDSQ